MAAALLPLLETYKRDYGEEPENYYNLYLHTNEIHFKI